MPPRIPGVSFADPYRLFQRFGWRFSHQAGSHFHPINSEGVYVTITRHGQRDIDARLLGQIVEDAGINPDHFLWGLVLQPHIDDGELHSSLEMGPSGSGLMPSPPPRPANGKVRVSPMLPEQAT